MSTSSSSLDELLKVYLATKLIGGAQAGSSGSGNASSQDGPSSSGSSGRASGSSSTTLAALASMLGQSSGEAPGRSSGQTSATTETGGSAEVVKLLQALLGGQGSSSGQGGGSSSQQASGWSGSPRQGLTEESTGTFASQSQGIQALLSTLQKSQSSGEGDASGQSQAANGGAGPSKAVIQLLSTLAQAAQQGGDGTTTRGSQARTNEAAGFGHETAEGGSSMAQSLAAREALLLRQAQEEFSQELEANLKRLREVIQETQTIAQKMEVALGKETGTEDQDPAGKRSSANHASRGKR